MTQFKQSEIYTTRSNADFVVLNRTPKTITISPLDGFGKRPKTLRVSNIEGVEVAFPDGKYSQCPVLKAA